MIVGTHEQQLRARYAQHRWGSSAVGMAFGDVHVGGKPVPLSTHVERGPSYDLRALLAAAVARNASSVIALKLDVEGSEGWLLEALTRVALSAPYAKTLCTAGDAPGGAEAAKAETTQSSNIVAALRGPRCTWARRRAAARPESAPV